MDCKKQGVEHFTVRTYHNENNTVYDYSSLPRPTHNLAYVYCGTVYASENGKTVRVDADELLYIPKNARYVSKWIGAEGVDFRTVHFDFDVHYDLFKNLKIPVQKFVPKDRQKIKAAFDCLLEHQTENTFEVNACFYGLLGELFKNAEYEENTTVSSVQPALDYIDANFNKKITVGELAKMCCLSEPRFYVLFKKETGESPIDYKNRTSISYAMTELVTEPGKSIEEIANDCGFETAVYFRRLFKSYSGKTPKEYRATSGII